MNSGVAFRIRIIARIILVLGIVLSLWSAIQCFSEISRYSGTYSRFGIEEESIKNKLLLSGVLTMFLGSFISYVINELIYGFGVLIESVSRNRAEAEPKVTETHEPGRTKDRECTVLRSTFDGRVICPDCNTKLTAGSKFCSFCGRRL